MSQIVPFKTMAISAELKKQHDIVFFAKKFLDKTSEQKFKELLGESTYDGIVAGMIIVGMAGTFVMLVVSAANIFPLSVFFSSVGSYIFLSTSVAYVLRKKVLHKKILEQVVQHENEEQAYVDDPLNQEAVKIIEKINLLNVELNAFNNLLKRIDDFRPLRDGEMTKYQLLTKERQALGAKILDFEERLIASQPQLASNEEKLTLTAAPIMNRADLEKQMEEKRKMIEATTAEYEKLKQEHTALYPRVMG